MSGTKLGAENREIMGGEHAKGQFRRAVPLAHALTQSDLSGNNIRADLWHIHTHMQHSSSTISYWFSLHVLWRQWVTRGHLDWVGVDVTLRITSWLYPVSVALMHAFFTFLSLSSFPIVLCHTFLSQLLPSLSSRSATVGKTPAYDSWITSSRSTAGVEQWNM